MDYRPSPPLPSSIARWLAILLVFCGVIPALAAEGRVALIIGNAAYTQKPLKNPVNDAEDLADTLKGLGFEVLLRKNRSEEQMKQDLVDFQDRLERNKGVGLFYFSGHGMQAGRGRNFLLPVGREYKRERDVETFGVDAGMVLARMEEAGSTLNIVILDACRDSPLPAESRSAGSRGLGRMEAPSGSLIAFSTAPGSVADDNAAGRNGLYTKHLISALRATDLRLEDVFKQVGREVEKESSRRQSPEEVSKLRDVKPFYFNLRGASPVTPVARPGASSFDLGDLEEQRKARAEWSAWQSRMQADYERVAGFKDEPEQQVKAWERFLSAYAGDNPFSSDDDRLREQARGQKSQLEARLAERQRTAASRPAVVPAPAGSGRRAGEVFKDCAECPELVVIPAGSFNMGSPKSEKERFSDEGPMHRVSIGYSLAVGRFEVTQGEWKALMGSNPSGFKVCGERCPVENVSWEDAQGYIRKLKEKTGKAYRLLSESEWEYVARAGTTGPFSTGQTITSDQANFDGKYTYNGSANGEYRQTTVKVGSFPPNAFGLYDVHGNVWEWVQDVWHDNYSGAPSDGSAWESGGDGRSRVLRGGGWFINSPDLARSAIRNRDEPDYRSNDSGFRLARTLP